MQSSLGYSKTATRRLFTMPGPILLERQAAFNLNPREQEVIGLIGKGLTNDEIAAQLFLSTATVKTYVARVGEKLGTGSRIKMAALYYGRGE